MPDPTGLELLAQDLRNYAGDDVIVATSHHRGQAAIEVRPPAVREVLGILKDRGYGSLMSVHGVDYYPHEPRLGVCYELLSHSKLDRIRVKVRVPIDAPEVPSVTPDWPTANHQEREILDLFGVVFEGHPDPRRILMPEDYEGHPQRRDFPMGGEPVLFTKDHDRDYTR